MIRLTVVDEPVGLQGVGLREAHVAVLALVRLLASVRAEVTLQLERVRGRVRAVGALDTHIIIIINSKLSIL